MASVGLPTRTNPLFNPCGNETDCSACEWAIIDAFMADNTNADASAVALYLVNNQNWLGKYAGADDKSLARLSCMGSEEMWFALISTYDDMGPFLCIISLIGIILYFVTSSDSGMLCSVE